jgi:predicted DNA-binding transcriptional regulator AlpA
VSSDLEQAIETFIAERVATYYAAAQRGAPEPRCVRMKQAATMLGVTSATIHRLIHTGELDSFSLSSFGSARLVTIASIDAYIARKVAEEKEKHPADRYAAFRAYVDSQQSPATARARRSTGQSAGQRPRDNRQSTDHA